MNQANEQTQMQTLVPLTSQDKDVLIQALQRQRDTLRLQLSQPKSKEATVVDRR